MPLEPAKYAALATTGRSPPKAPLAIGHSIRPLSSLSGGHNTRVQQSQNLYANRAERFAESVPS